MHRSSFSSRLRLWHSFNQTESDSWKTGRKYFLVCTKPVSKPVTKRKWMLSSHNLAGQVITYMWVHCVLQTSGYHGKRENRHLTDSKGNWNKIQSPTVLYLRKSSLHLECLICSTRTLMRLARIFPLERKNHKTKKSGISTQYSWCSESLK